MVGSAWHCKLLGRILPENDEDLEEKREKAGEIEQARLLLLVKVEFPVLPPPHPQFDEDADVDDEPDVDAIDNALSAPPELFLSTTTTESALPLPQLLPSAVLEINRDNIPFAEFWFLAKELCRRRRIRRGAVADADAEGTPGEIISAPSPSSTVVVVASVQAQHSPAIMILTLALSVAVAALAAWLMLSRGGASTSCGRSKEYHLSRE